MNCYIAENGNKYYCLNPINTNSSYYYNHKRCELFFLSDTNDDSRNLLHKIDGPAIELHTGDKHWFFMGKRHREDGQAIDHLNYKGWYYNGDQINCKDNKEFLKIMSMKAFL